MQLQDAIYHEVSCYFSANIVKKGNKRTRKMKTGNLCYPYPAQ